MLIDSTDRLNIARVPKITTLVFALLSLAAASSARAQTSKPNAEPCAATAETSDWNLYVNRKHGFCFRYPNGYKSLPLPAPDARSKRRPYEHGLFYLKRPAIDAEIMAIFNDQAFDLENLINIAAPTGNTFRPERIDVGRFTFYYYGAGGGGAEYPDVYFFNLNGKPSKYTSRAHIQTALADDASVYEPRIFLQRRRLNARSSSTVGSFVLQQQHQGI